MPPLFPFLSPLCLGSVLSRHDRDPKMSTHIRIAAVLWDETIKSLCLCLFVDRDPNVSTHIRIAAVLWDETIKGLCVCAHVCVLSLMVWSQSKAAIRM